MQQVSKVILFFTRRKICRSSEASAQIRRVAYTNFLAPVSLDNNFFDTQNLKIFSCVNPWTLMPKKFQFTYELVKKNY
jgi:hypothetical protein